MGWKELGKERAGECPRLSLYLMLQVELEGGGHRCSQPVVHPCTYRGGGLETGQRKEHRLEQSQASERAASARRCGGT